MSPKKPRGEALAVKKTEGKIEIPRKLKEAGEGKTLVENLQGEYAKLGRRNAEIESRIAELAKQLPDLKKGTFADAAKKIIKEAGLISKEIQKLKKSADTLAVEVKAEAGGKKDAAEALADAIAGQMTRETSGPAPESAPAAPAPKAPEKSPAPPAAAEAVKKSEAETKKSRFINTALKKIGELEKRYYKLPESKRKGLENLWARKSWSRIDQMRDMIGNVDADKLESAENKFKSWTKDVEQNMAAVEQAAAETKPAAKKEAAPAPAKKAETGRVDSEKRWNEEFQSARDAWNGLAERYKNFGTDNKLEEVEGWEEKVIRQSNDLYDKIMLMRDMIDDEKKSAQFDKKEFDRMAAEAKKDFENLRRTVVSTSTEAEKTAQEAPEEKKPEAPPAKAEVAVPPPPEIKTPEKIKRKFSKNELDLLVRRMAEEAGKVIGTPAIEKELENFRSIAGALKGIDTQIGVNNLESGLEKTGKALEVLIEEQSKKEKAAAAPALTPEIIAAGKETRRYTDAQIEEAVASYNDNGKLSGTLGLRKESPQLVEAFKSGKKIAEDLYAAKNINAKPEVLDDLAEKFINKVKEIDDLMKHLQAERARKAAASPPEAAFAPAEGEPETETPEEAPKKGFLEKMKGVFKKASTTEIKMPEKVKRVADKLFNKETGKVAADVAYKTVGSVLGVKFAADLVGYAAGKVSKGKLAFGDIHKYAVSAAETKEEKVDIETSFEIFSGTFANYLDAYHKSQKEQREAPSKDLVKEKCAALLEKIQSSKNISEKEKDEFKRRIGHILRDHVVKERGTEEEIQKKAKEATGLYIKNKVSGMNIAKDALNTMLTASGLMALRGAVYAGASVAERIASARTKYKKEAAGKEKKLGEAAFILKDTFVNSTMETLRGVAFWTGEREKKQRAADFLKALGTVARGLGIYGVALSGVSTGEGLTRLMSAMHEHGVAATVKDNFVHNAERIWQVYTHPGETLKKVGKAVHLYEGAPAAGAAIPAAGLAEHAAGPKFESTIYHYPEPQAELSVHTVEVPKGAGMSRVLLDVLKEKNPDASKKELMESVLALLKKNGWNGYGLREGAVLNIAEDAEGNLIVPKPEEVEGAYLMGKGAPGAGKEAVDKLLEFEKPGATAEHVTGPKVTQAMAPGEYRVAQPGEMTAPEIPLDERGRPIYETTPAMEKDAAFTAYRMEESQRELIAEKASFKEAAARVAIEEARAGHAAAPAAEAHLPAEKHVYADYNWQPRDLGIKHNGSEIFAKTYQSKDGFVSNFLYDEKGNRVGFMGTDRRAHFHMPKGGWPEGVKEHADIPVSKKEAVAKEVAAAIKEQAEAAAGAGKFDAVHPLVINESNLQGKVSFTYGPNGKVIGYETSSTNGLIPPELRDPVDLREKWFSKLVTGNMDKLDDANGRFLESHIRATEADINILKQLEKAGLGNSAEANYIKGTISDTLKGAFGNATSELNSDGFFSGKKPQEIFSPKVWQEIKGYIK